MVKPGKLQILQQYKFIQEIGSGGFSRVYKAKSVKTNEVVAIKVVRVVEENVELKRIIENEVEVMRHVTDNLSGFSKNFVQFYDLVYDPDQMSIAMEYLDGGELFDRIVQQTKFSENDAARVTRQVIAALDALHTSGIVHRDLKPENLVYATKSRKSDLKIMDFGLSWFMGEKDIHSKARYVGTPGYISPEVILRKQYAPAADIWSMGVILFIMLSGRMPFGGRNTNMLNSKVVTASFNMTGGAWKQISDNAKDLVRRMLTVDPTKRITAKELLKHPWIVEDHGGFNLGTTLASLAEFNDRRKIENEVKKMLKKTSDDMQKQLLQLVGSTTESTLGLTLDDINRVRKAFRDEKGGVLPPTDVKVSREEFIETMEKLGFGKMPLDEIFTALANQYDDDALIKEDIRRRGPSFVERDDTGKAMLGRNETKIQLDEILVGLSTVVAVESRERLIHFLYDSFSQAEGEKGLSARSLVKILRVLASYDRPKDRARIDAISARIRQLFTPFSEDEEQEEGSGISYDEFKSGLMSFGEDIFQAFFVDPATYVGDKVDKYSQGWLSKKAKEQVDTVRTYVERISTYAATIGGNWNAEDEHGEEKA